MSIRLRHLCFDVSLTIYRFLSILMSMSSSVCVPLYLSALLSLVFYQLSACLSIYLSICLSVLSVRLTCQSGLSVCLSVYLSVCLSEIARFVGKLIDLGIYRCLKRRPRLDNIHCLPFIVSSCIMTYFVLVLHLSQLLSTNSQRYFLSSRDCSLEFY